MGMYGRHMVFKDGRKFMVEPISTNAFRNADWGATDTTNLPVGGAVHPNDSLITEANGFKNIVILDPGTSPYSYIDKICKDGNT